jgi:hypothetical protein
MYPVEEVAVTASGRPESAGISCSPLGSSDPDPDSESESESERRWVCGGVESETVALCQRLRHRSRASSCPLEIVLVRLTRSLYEQMHVSEQFPISQ